MFQITSYKTSKQSYAEKESLASSFIPYQCHYNGSTILTKSKELMKTVRVAGFSFETADDEDVDTKKQMLS